MENKTRNVISTAALVAMGALALGSVFGLPFSGMSVLVGVAACFLSRRKSENHSLDLKAAAKALSNKGIWLWIALPTLLNFASIGLAQLVLPQFNRHILARTGQFLSFSRLPLLAVQLAVSALGEEIAWRGFFQHQLGKTCPFPVALLVTSAVFSLAHLSSGAAVLVFYDLLFIALNSICYGVAFQKSGSVWASTFAHFVANATAILLLFAL